MWTDDELESRIKQTVEWLRGKVQEANAKGLVVGLSGGVDSAVTAGLCSRAFPENNMGVIMPSHSAAKDKEDALLAAACFQMPTAEVELSAAHTQIMGQIKENLARLACRIESEQLSQGNLKARLRMSALYAVANALNYMVVGTDNEPESYIGYFTKYGDGGVDLLPIASLTKSEVRAWARVMGLPEGIVSRAPSAGLWPGQTDEAEIGVSYDLIDRYLLGETVPPEARERIENLHSRSVHKRQMPPAFVLPKLKELGQF